MVDSKKDSKSKLTKASTLVAALVLLSASGVMTKASFSDSGGSSISAAAGTLAVTLGKDLDSEIGYISTDFGTDWYPGKPAVNQTFTIANTGTVPIKFTVVHSPTHTVYPLHSKINLLIKSGSTTVYNGKISNLSSASASSPMIAGGATETLTMTVTWPTSSDDRSYAGSQFSGVNMLNFVFTS